MKIVILLSAVIVLFSKKILACSVTGPEIIPPDSPFGEFQYVYPDPSKAKSEAVKNSKNLAVVKLHSDSVSESEDGYKVAVAVLELLHGWGFQSGRYMKFTREETSCGEPEKIEGGGWFVALICQKEVCSLIPYSDVKEEIEERGKPDYVYSAIGVLRN
ncbi:hypothetical protein [Microbulbifer celer]|uniref:Uncharacterized protein n=1 Tax=Microbulbifer celer TaxID=435905 RepID=A0ABW3UAJ1_9GAMM|nr:hypothetical protein [Microbulbifer celer]UFN56467.1 hypothetical protein LPW13_12910 [Microbulbifer celer]